MTKTKSQNGKRRKASTGVAITFPVGTGDVAGYVQRHLDFQLNPRQASALKRLLTVMDRRAIRLESGKVVHSTADVVRWWLDQYAALACKDA